MKVYSDISMQDFEFWGAARTNAEKLTEAELQKFENEVNEAYPDGISDSQLNDWMAFDFESVCSILDVVYDDDTGEVLR